jgi:hypothetical protein
VSPAVKDLDAFRKRAGEQQARVDWLLAIRRRFRVPSTRDAADRAKVKWTADIPDPEFQKNLRIFRRLIRDAVAICERKSTSDVATMDERLSELITLPSDRPLTLKALLGLRFDLERCLIEVGDEEYLASRAADFYCEGPGTIVTWDGLVSKGVLCGPPPLLAAVMPGTPSSVGSQEAELQDDPKDQTRRMLAVLIAAKEAEDLPLRGRRELKQEALRIVVPVITLAAILLGVAIAIVEDEVEDVLLAAAAGAAGAALGGLLRLRDDIRLGSQIREFRTFFIGQIVVGVVAGLLVFLVVRGEILSPTGGMSGLAALAFAAGFSEAALLGLIRRLGETVGSSPSA